MLSFIKWQELCTDVSTTQKYFPISLLQTQENVISLVPEGMAR